MRNSHVNHLRRRELPTAMPADALLRQACSAVQDSPAPAPPLIAATEHEVGVPPAAEPMQAIQQDHQQYAPEDLMSFEDPPSVDRPAREEKPTQLKVVYKEATRPQPCSNPPCGTSIPHTKNGLSFVFPTTG